MVTWPVVSPRETDQAELTAAARLVTAAEMPDDRPDATLAPDTTHSAEHKKSVSPFVAPSWLPILNAAAFVRLPIADTSTALLIDAEPPSGHTAMRILLAVRSSTASPTYHAATGWATDAAKPVDASRTANSTTLPVSRRTRHPAFSTEHLEINEIVADDASA